VPPEKGVGGDDVWANVKVTWSKYEKKIHMIDLASINER
jgi:hypothetical protein